MLSDTLPYGVTVCVRCNTLERQVRSITCFRCGEYGHYRGECHTFKTQPCTRFLTGSCTQPANVCPFAHGATELRKPWSLKCVRVVKVAGTVEVLGCGRVGHTYRSCPDRHSN